MPSTPKPRVRSDIWQLHEAKARFSELFRAVVEDGPQRVTKQGGEVVVIVAAEQFDRLTTRSAQPSTLAAFFRSAPTGSRGLPIPRSKHTTRDVDW